MAETGTKVILAINGIEQQPQTLSAALLDDLLDADSFTNALLDRIIADDAFDATLVANAFATDSFTDTIADDIIQVGALGEDLLTANEVDARCMRRSPLLAVDTNMSTLAADRANPELVWVFEIADAAAGSVNFTNIPEDILITNVRYIKNGVASGGDTVVLLTDIDGGTGYADLVAAVNIGAGAGDVTNAAALVPAQAQVDAGGHLRFTTVGVAGDRGYTAVVTFVKR